MEREELTVSLPTDLVQKIAQDARRQETSRSAIVRQALRQVYPRSHEGEPDGN